jgi:magnesium and cobalt transporter
MTKQSNGRPKNLKNLVSKIMSFFIKPDKTKLEDCVISLIEKSDEHGRILHKAEKDIIHNLIHIGEKDLRDIMIPRTDMIAISSDTTLDELKTIASKHKHTRIPVYEENLDKMIGFVHVKDILQKPSAKKKLYAKDILREILIVPPSLRPVDLLVKMRTSRVHIAVVIDEYGGTDGLVTLENLVEEIVGDIQDEHDQPTEEHYFKKLASNKIQVSGRYNLIDLEEMYSIALSKEDDEFDTVGGFICAQLGHVPEKGEKLKFEDRMEFEVIEADPRNIKLVNISLLQS